MRVERKYVFPCKLILLPTPSYLHRKIVLLTSVQSLIGCARHANQERTGNTRAFSCMHAKKGEVAGDVATQRQNLYLKFLFNVLDNTIINIVSTHSLLLYFFLNILVYY